MFYCMECWHLFYMAQIPETRIRQTYWCWCMSLRLAVSFRIPLLRISLRSSSKSQILIPNPSKLLQVGTCTMEDDNKIVEIKKKNLCLHNRANFNQTWHKTSLGEASLRFQVWTNFNQTCMIGKKHSWVKGTYIFTYKGPFISYRVLWFH